MGRDPLVIVSESLEWGGTERVVEAVADLWPQAPIVAADFARPRGAEGGELGWFPRARRVTMDERKHHFLAPLYSRRMAAAGVGPAGVVLAFSHHGWGLG